MFFPIILILISWVAALFICTDLGDKKDHIALGWVIGLLFGWIGVIAMLCVSKTYEQEVYEAARRMRIEQEARDHLGGAS
jgi:hypothetical protein